MRKSLLTIGTNKGVPRIWLEGKWMEHSGFHPGIKINVTITERKITVTPDSNGKRIVSGKKKGTVPVIDLSSNDIHNTFGKYDKVQVTAELNQIIIIPSLSLVLIERRQLVKTEASIFSGAGFLSLAAKRSGFLPKVAVDINSRYVDLFEANNPDTTVFNMPIHEVSLYELMQFKPIGVFTAGIPCEPFSKIRRLDRGGQEKRDKKLVPESHELGDMALWCMMVINILNPHTVVLEQVPSFLDSGAGNMLINALRRRYLSVDTRIMNPIDYGSLTGRKRAVIVAQDRPIKWPAIELSKGSLGEIFDGEPHEWFDKDSKPWLFNHWEKQTAKGNGFASQIYDHRSPHVGTIKKRYFAGQGDNPVIKHDSLNGKYRWLTLPEVKKLHGIPENYYLGDSKTIAGEVIGQGVVVDMFQKIISSITN